MKHLISIVLVAFFLVSSASAHLPQNHGFRLSNTTDSRISSSGIVDIRFDGGNVWVATGEGLSITRDAGQTWTHITHNQGIGRGSVTAIDMRNGEIWAATGFDTLTSADSNPLPAGGGVGYSLDDGNTWTWFPQPVDSRDENAYKPTTTNVQNITYDLVLTESAVWIASFGGGLRRSTDKGKTWQVATVDGLPFDALGRLTHRAFSVHYDGEALWAGTAGGVHKSTDGGQSWITYSHQNQERGISGNFVVAIATQNLDGRNVIWAGTKETTIESGDSTEFMAASMSEDGGMTWSTPLKNEFVHNFAFDGYTVYAASDNGLFKSPDGGETWAVFPKIVDDRDGTAVYSNAASCAGIGPDLSLWVGTDDGLAVTTDDGLSWRVFRGFERPGEAGTPDTYAYPNPFSPLRHNLSGEEGHVRFQYRIKASTRVTLRIYDFGMHLVCTVVKDKIRSSPGDFAEVWNGMNGVGDTVANGVYFYKIELEGQGTFWGKVMVLN